MNFRVWRAVTAGTILHSRSASMHRTPVVHSFAGLGLDRSACEGVKEPAELSRALAEPSSLFLPLFESKPLVYRATPTSPPRPVWQSLEQLRESLGLSLEALLEPPPSGGVAPLCLALGRHGDGSWRFALDVSGEMEGDTKLVEGERGFESVRALLAVMGKEDVAVAGQAAALMNWHGQHRFCGLCGSPMVPIEGGGRRKCTACRNRAYPRTDPVCIVLVYDPATDRCLLGRQHVYRPGMYSCLAGFVEQCESLEEAVKREVKEEAGIEVGRLLYHSSQPWPIGRGASCQLMIGFIAEATSTEIRLDTKELEDAQWFSREEVAGAKELVAVPLPNEATGTQEGQAHISIPGPYAIAHHLIKHWLELPPRHRL